MKIAALHRKLLRELSRLKGQMISIALVVATGVLTVVTMRGGYDALVQAQNSYYADYRFADAWISLKRAPEGLRHRIESIPGVNLVDTRVTFFATLDLPQLDMPALGRFVSVPDRGRPVLNDVHLTSGRYLAPGAWDEVLVSQNFAGEHDFESGDGLSVIINGRARNLTIVGTAISPEHGYAVPPGSLYPDDERYGILWMSREALGPAYEMDGAFNEAFVTFSEGADREAVLTRLDDLLEPYGGQGAYGREDQLSHQILQGELDQNRVMGSAIPAIFLMVAAFLLNLVLGRLIATQRTEVAVLKAFGYSNRQVALHYLGYAVAAVFAGALIGTVGGVWTGDSYIRMYSQYFDFPALEYALKPSLLAIAIVVSAIAAAVGALGAVRRAVNLPPAEAMRPEPPARFRPGWVERTGLGHLLPPAGRMILRQIERRPLRSFLSALGVAFSVSILVVGMFMFDGVSFMMDQQFRVIQREDLTVTFERPTLNAVRHELGALEGVSHIETYRVVPARLTVGHRRREIGIQGMQPDGHLRRIMTQAGTVHPLVAQGLVMSALVAEELDVTVGDLVNVKILEGRRTTAVVPVAGVVNDFLGVAAYMRRDVLQDLTGGPDVASGAYLTAGAVHTDRLSRTISHMPGVASVATPGRMLEMFEAQLTDSLFIGVAFLLGFAGIISVGIIYNGARISLSERGRELASLRVMGFRRSEVSVLLLGEQALVTLLAIPLGFGLGYLFALSVVNGFQTETFRIPLVISTRTYLISAVTTILMAVVSGALVRRRINRLDLVEVLKTRE